MLNLCKIIDRNGVCRSLENRKKQTFYGLNADLKNILQLQALSLKKMLAFPIRSEYIYKALKQEPESKH